MKKHLLFLFMILTINANTQNWAPIGARWSYSVHIWHSNDDCCIILKSIGEIDIQGKKCKIIQLTGVNPICNYIPYSKTDLIYLYSDSNKVYFYGDQLEKFYLLYDFTKNSRDTFYIKRYKHDMIEDSTGFRIIQTGDTLIYNKLLRTQEVVPLIIDGIGLPGKIIEFIGHEIFLFPFEWCTTSMSLGLLGYSDSLINNVDESMTPQELLVYPNPTCGIVTIKTDNINISAIRVYDVYGIEILRINNSHTIDLSIFPNGIYIFEIIDFENKMIITKVIKNNS